MGLPLRITFKEKDYVYEISNTINKTTNELDILLNGEKIRLIKDIRKGWMQKEGEITIDPEFAQALGRSVSSLYRM